MNWFDRVTDYINRYEHQRSGKLTELHLIQSGKMAPYFRDAQGPVLGPEHFANNLTAEIAELDGIIADARANLTTPPAAA